MTGEEFCNIVQGTVIIDGNGYAYVMGNDYLYADNPDEPFTTIRFHKFNYRDARIATEEEAQNFFKKLEKNGYTWNSERNEIEKTSKRIVDEDLLLTDLSGRLKYGVMCDRLEQVYPLISIKTKPYVQFELERGKGDTAFYAANEIKPYLRPMSSIASLISAKKWTNFSSIERIDWYNANHIDYRGLIEKGLALEAPKEMYNLN